MGNFLGKVCQFPCKYIGLPLHIGRLCREAEQVLIDKIGAKLPGWKGKLLTKSGRLTQVQSVLSAIPSYHMTAFPLSKWAVNETMRLWSQHIFCIDRGYIYKLQAAKLLARGARADRALGGSAGRGRRRG
jgi:hypothetical protein